LVFFQSRTTSPFRHITREFGSGRSSDIAMMWIEWSAMWWQEPERQPRLARKDRPGDAAEHLDVAKGSPFGPPVR
jgi:hypothetical protein